MMTTTVGVRDLKRDAPRLVRRAARGERIVITRYGRPLAALVAAEDEAHDKTSPATQAWNAERRAFESLRPGLRRHRGRYVAVHRGRVVGVHKDADALYERTWRKLRGEVFFIGRVDAAPEIVDMPGAEIA